jgi:excisionase family DNA binding protein
VQALSYSVQSGAGDRKGDFMAICYSVKMAAEECGLSERTIHAAIKDGRLQVIRVGRRVLITPTALDDYLNGRTGEKGGAQ